MHRSVFCVQLAGVCSRVANLFFCLLDAFELGRLNFLMCCFAHSRRLVVPFGEGVALDSCIVCQLLFSVWSFCFQEALWQNSLANWVSVSNQCRLKQVSNTDQLQFCFGIVGLRGCCSLQWLLLAPLWWKPVDRWPWPEEGKWSKLTSLSLQPHVSGSQNPAVLATLGGVSSKVRGLLTFPREMDVHALINHNSAKCGFASI